MIDPLSQMVLFLQPAAPFSKRVSGAGRWCIRRTEVARPFYCAMLEGQCCLAAEGHPERMLREGDFVLIPAAQNFTLSSRNAARGKDIACKPLKRPDGEFRLGQPDGEPDVRLLIGYCSFRSANAHLLASLLPQLMHVSGVDRLTTFMQLVSEETHAQRPARDIVLERLLEVLLIEAFRSGAKTDASPGLLRGLADERLAVAIRCMHESPHLPWTVAKLAKESSLSRSAFYERFGRAVGLAPMQYLLAWRMALAKELLCTGQAPIAEVAERIGYGSASAFSVAFARHVGQPPSRYARSSSAKTSAQHAVA